MGGSVVYLHRHEGRAPRGTILMGQDVTGMDRASLTALVLQRAASASLTLTVDGTPTTVPLARIAQVDARATVEAAVSGAGSLMTHLHGIVGTRQVAVRYVVSQEARAALVSQLSSTARPRRRAGPDLERGQRRLHRLIGTSRQRHRPR